MRNDDHDEIDLSQHRASRLPGILVIVAALGVAGVAAWVFTPILMSKDSAATAGLFNRTKAPPAAQNQPAAPPAAATLASAQSTPVAPAASAQPDAATDDQTASLGPAVASAGPSTPWPQDRGIQVAAATAGATPDTAPDTATEPAVTPAEPFDNVPLPRKRPSRLIAASLTIPLPRPRPEIEPDTPTAPSAFDLQVERMR